VLTTSCAHPAPGWMPGFQHAHKSNTFFDLFEHDRWHSLSISNSNNSNQMDLSHNAALWERADKENILAIHEYSSPNQGNALTLCSALVKHQFGGTHMWTKTDTTTQPATQPGWWQRPWLTELVHITKIIISVTPRSGGLSVPIHFVYNSCQMTVPSWTWSGQPGKKGHLIKQALRDGKL